MTQPDREHLELTVADDQPVQRRGCSILAFLLCAILLAAVPRAAQNVNPAATLEEARQDLSGQLGASFGDGSDLAMRGWDRDGSSGIPLPAVPHGASEPIASTPAPTAEIGTALWTASATWCAPTPTQCRKWGGHALLAALPTYTGVPYWVRVRYGSRHVDVEVVSICGCGIDLTPWAFQQLAPLSRGRLPVEVEGPIAPLPNTDEENR